MTPSPLFIKIAVLIAMAASLHSAYALDGKDCKIDMKAGASCVIELPDLRPTQLSVGYRVVKEKAKKLHDMDDSDYKDYLYQHPVPVVIGNGGQFYILDHHHLSRAVYELDKKKVMAKVIANWNNKSSGQFWSDMISAKYVYLKGNDGSPRTPADLPRFIQQLTDDPYRSLSGNVRDEGGYIKGNVYFIEFIWALYFRNHIQIGDSFKDAVKQAVALAHSPASSSMPGYSAVKVKNPD